MQNLNHVENIMNRDIIYQLKRLEIDRTLSRRRNSQSRSHSGKSRGGALHEAYQRRYQQRTQQGHGSGETGSDARSESQSPRTSQRSAQWSSFHTSRQHLGERSALEEDGLSHYYHQHLNEYHLYHLQARSPQYGLRGDLASHYSEPSNESFPSYEFIMDEWVEMMQLMPSLQELDLGIISLLPRTEITNDSNIISGGGTRSPTYLDNRTTARKHKFARRDFRMGYGTEVGVEERDAKDDSHKVGGFDHHRMALTNEDDNYFYESRRETETLESVVDMPSLGSGYSGSQHYLERRNSRTRNYTSCEAKGYNTLLHSDLKATDTTQDLEQSHRDIADTSITDGPSSEGNFEPSGNDGRNPNNSLNHDLENLEEATSSGPSQHLQFPSIRSLVFRGTIILPELLEFLPNLESLALEDAPYGSKTDKNGNPQSMEPTPLSPHSSFVLVGLADMVSGR
ncbi:hypothetical protein BGX26_007415 [Mortierella sp. AD094]|nr:hypothetical protein BGX26_007415 [Mortierella sp. AD094]